MDYSNSQKSQHFQNSAPLSKFNFDLNESHYQKQTKFQPFVSNASSELASLLAKTSAMIKQYDDSAIQHIRAQNQVHFPSASQRGNNQIPNWDNQFRNHENKEYKNDYNIGYAGHINQQDYSPIRKIQNIQEPQVDFGKYMNSKKQFQIKRSYQSQLPFNYLTKDNEQKQMTQNGHSYSYNNYNGRDDSSNLKQLFQQTSTNHQTYHISFDDHNKIILPQRNGNQNTITHRKQTSEKQYSYPHQIYTPNRQISFTQIEQQSNLQGKNNLKDQSYASNTNQSILKANQFILKQLSFQNSPNEQNNAQMSFQMGSLNISQIKRPQYQGKYEEKRIKRKFGPQNDPTFVYQTSCLPLLLLTALFLLLVTLAVLATTSLINVKDDQLPRFKQSQPQNINQQKGVNPFYNNPVPTYQPQKVIPPVIYYPPVAYQNDSSLQNKNKTQQNPNLLINNKNSSNPTQIVIPIQPIFNNTPNKVNNDTNIVPINNIPNLTPINNNSQVIPQNNGPSLIPQNNGSNLVQKNESNNKPSDQVDLNSKNQIKIQYAPIFQINSLQAKNQTKTPSSPVLNTSNKNIQNSSIYPIEIKNNQVQIQPQIYTVPLKDQTIASKIKIQNPILNQTQFKPFQIYEFSPQKISQLNPQKIERLYPQKTNVNYVNPLNIYTLQLTPYEYLLPVQIQYENENENQIQALEIDRQNQVSATIIYLTRPESVKPQIIQSYDNMSSVEPIKQQQLINAQIVPLKNQFLPTPIGQIKPQIIDSVSVLKQQYIQAIKITNQKQNKQIDAQVVAQVKPILEQMFFPAQKIGVINSSMSLNPEQIGVIYPITTNQYAPQRIETINTITTTQYVPQRIQTTNPITTTQYSPQRIETTNPITTTQYAPQRIETINPIIYLAPETIATLNPESTILNPQYIAEQISVIKPNIQKLPYEIKPQKMFVIDPTIINIPQQFSPERVGIIQPQTSLVNLFFPAQQVQQINAQSNLSPKIIQVLQNPNNIPSEVIPIQISIIYPINVAVINTNSVYPIGQSWVNPQKNQPNSQNNQLIQIPATPQISPQTTQIAQPISPQIIPSVQPVKVQITPIIQQSLPAIIQQNQIEPQQVKQIQPEIIPEIQPVRFAPNAQQNKINYIVQTKNPNGSIPQEVPRNIKISQSQKQIVLQVDRKDSAWIIPQNVKKLTNQNIKNPVDVPSNVINLSKNDSQIIYQVPSNKLTLIVPENVKDMSSSSVPTSQSNNYQKQLIIQVNRTRDQIFSIFPQNVKLITKSKQPSQNGSNSQNSFADIPKQEILEPVGKVSPTNIKDSSQNKITMNKQQIFRVDKNGTATYLGKGQLYSDKANGQVSLDLEAISPSNVLKLENRKKNLRQES